MVYYFTCIDPEYVVYMGRDKYENEDLIKYAWPEDVWFHVDKYSSAHVYLRLKPNQDITQIPANVIEDMVQLTKENSIEGKKLNNVKVIYTMASNLKKASEMDIGEVGFHDRNQVHSVTVAKRNREIVNRLKKTKIEDPNPNLQKLREERDLKEREQKKKETREKKQQEKREVEQKRKEAGLKSYDNLFQADKMKSNRKKSKGKTNNLDDVFGEDGDVYGDFNDLDDLL